MPPQAAAERVKTLSRTLGRCQRDTANAQAAVSNLLQAIFAVRYRDVCPEIRAHVIQVRRIILISNIQWNALCTQVF